MAFKKKIYAMHSVMIQGLSFLTNIIVLEKLEPKIYATYIISVSFAAIIHNFATLGVSVRFKHLILNEFNIISIIKLVSLMLFLITVVGSYYNELFGMVFLNITIIFYQGLISQLYLVNDHLIKAASIPILSQCTALLAIFFSSSLNDFILMCIVINFLLLILQFILSRKYIKNVFLHKTKISKIIDMRAYLGTMLDITYARVDILILGFLMTTETLAQYNIAKMIMHSIVNIFVNYTRGYTKELNENSNKYPIYLSVLKFYALTSIVILFLLTFSKLIIHELEKLLNIEITLLTYIIVEFGFACLLGAVFLSCGRSVLYYFTLVGKFTLYAVILLVNLVVFICIILAGSYLDLTVDKLLITIGCAEALVIAIFFYLDRKKAF